MAFLSPSQALLTLMATKDWDSAMDSADSSCTTGYDNDGSTGLDIFENGFDLAAKAAANGSKVYAFENEDSGIMIFFIAKDDTAMSEKLEELPDHSVESEDDEEGRYDDDDNEDEEDGDDGDI